MIHGKAWPGLYWQGAPRTSCAFRALLFWYGLINTGLSHLPLMYSTNKEHKKESTKWVDVVLLHFRAEIIEMIKKMCIVSREALWWQGWDCQVISARGVISALRVTLFCTVPICFKKHKWLHHVSKVTGHATLWLVVEECKNFHSQPYFPLVENHPHILNNM